MSNAERTYRCTVAFTLTVDDFKVREALLKLDPKPYGAEEPETQQELEFRAERLMQLGSDLPPDERMRWLLRYWNARLLEEYLGFLEYTVEINTAVDQTSPTM
jgi:hypothetical protein